MLFFPFAAEPTKTLPASGQTFSSVVVVCGAGGGEKYWALGESLMCHARASMTPSEGQ